MATRKQRGTTTSAELKVKLEAAKKRLADLEKRAYAEELSELMCVRFVVPVAVWYLGY